MWDGFHSRFSPKNEGEHTTNIAALERSRRRDLFVPKTHRARRLFCTPSSSPSPSWRKKSSFVIRGRVGCVLSLACYRVPNNTTPPYDTKHTHPGMEFESRFCPKPAKLVALWEGSRQRSLHNKRVARRFFFLLFLPTLPVVEKTSYEIRPRSPREGVGEVFSHVHPLCDSKYDIPGVS